MGAARRVSHNVDKGRVLLVQMVKLEGRAEVKPRIAVLGARDDAVRTAAREMAVDSIGITLIPLGAEVD